jgi:hypothetical protein
MNCGTCVPANLQTLANYLLQTYFRTVLTLVVVMDTSDQYTHNSTVFALPIELKE